MTSMASASEQTALLVGALTHLSRFLHSGCPRAAHQASVLLHQFDDSELGAELAHSCELIDQLIAAPRRQ